MRPLDPRLLRYARSARGYVFLTTGLGVVTAALVVCQALLLAHALGGAVHDGATLAELGPTIAWLAVVVAARVLVTTGQERFAHRAATATIAELREQVVEHAVALGPRWLATGEGPGVVTLATRGLDNLQPYFVRYLPQLLLAATVTPGVLLVVLGLDWISAAIMVAVLPLVPIFMILDRPAHPGAVGTRPGRRCSGSARRCWTCSPVCRRCGRTAVSAGRAPGCGPSATPTARRRWARCGSPSCPAWCSSS